MYRLRVIHRLPTLLMLDGTEVRHSAAAFGFNSTIAHTAGLTRHSLETIPPLATNGHQSTLANLTHARAILGLGRMYVRASRQGPAHGKAL